MSIVAKKVAEEFQLEFRYTSDRLDAGQTISSCVVTSSPAGITLNGAATIDGNTVKQFVSGGTAGSEYYLTFTTTLSDGSVYLDDIVVQVT